MAGAQHAVPISSQLRAAVMYLLKSTYVPSMHMDAYVRPLEAFLNEYDPHVQPGFSPQKRNNNTVLDAMPSMIRQTYERYLA